MEFHLKKFDVELRDSQANWLQSQIALGYQVEHEQSAQWILPAAAWKEGLWKGIRDSLPQYIDRNKIKKHTLSNNLKSSWILSANLYFPFSEEDGRKLLAGFLRGKVSSDILSVDRLE